MSIVELFKLLQKLREMTPSISNHISPNDLKANFDDIVKEINSILPLAEKEVKDIKILLGVIQSLRKENESLKKQAVAKVSEQDFNTQEWKTTDQSFANPILSKQLSSLSSPQNITKENSSPSEHREEPSIPSSQNITKENSNPLQSNKEPNTFLSQNITKESSNSLQDYRNPSLDSRQNIKPKAAGFGFYDTKSGPTSSKENIASAINNLEESDYSSHGLDYSKPNIRDYYNDEETMKQLQIDAEELEDLVTRKRLSPQTIDGKRYFGKKEVSLIRSLTMELSTIIMPKPKPKKKNPLQFWKD